MKLTHPLIVLDLETTGTWVEKDKIVEIAMVRCDPDGSRTPFHRRVNPGIPIPPEVSEIIGITDADVKDAPPFKDIAAEVLSFIGDADLGGFNHERFDLPVLQREFKEVGLPFDWSDCKRFDAQRVFHSFERRDLTAAYKFYCGKDLVNAHSAMADTEATLEIIEAQIARYGQGKPTLDSIQVEERRKTQDRFDAEGKFRWWNGELYPVFGKYARKWSLREIAQKDPRYLQWIASADFSRELKTLAKDAMNGIFPEKKSGAAGGA